MNKNRQPLFSVPLSKLEDFLQDSIYFRDARAYTRLPSLRFGETSNGEEELRVFNKFLMHHDYVIKKSSGERFAEITNDKNEIHRFGNVVPGAMTVSKIIIPLEILIPELEIHNVSIKFTNSSIYDEKTKDVFTFRFISSEYVQIEVNTFQSQKTIAKTNITGRINPAREKAAKIKEEDVNETKLNTVREYFDTLAIESEAYIQKEGYRDYTYPLSYIAALPSGEIVKQMEGDGGMLNILKLNFGNVKMIPITDEKGPEVKLERTRERTTFNKIITEIVNGLVTYYRGLAIVNPVAKFRNPVNSVISPVK
ncbi:MAG: hypothetical protein SCARUB_02631 [Candidatus Scalindua rubra]|uniref:Uncharacterized protein n=1 Tax=Candidatus Scalindua rubra TaxID=1872076 RepID=A0A1E3X9D3_9BACT|nr:MAG: hypothetical protein SCARUB_02631 [Candidatus Scalindua rubra]